MAYPLQNQSYTPHGYAGTQVPAHSTFVYVKKRVYKKTQKKNVFKILCNLIFLGLFAYYCVPYTYTHYTSHMFTNRILNRNLNFEMSQYASPSLNYITNANQFGQDLLVAPNKTNKTMLSIISSGNMIVLESKLKRLAAQYPSLNPSVYVWDYENGKSASVNADKPTPLASTVKIPVLFEMFRQIDSKTRDLELNKKIIFDEAHRTSGSGDLQYTAAGQTYSVDYLTSIMITKSDNSATNIILDEIGGRETLNRAMRNWGLKSARVSNLLPDLEGTNKMSAKELSTILYNLDNPKFLSARSREHIKEYMGNLPTKNLIRAGLPEDAIFLHKTGDIGKMLGDAGIVYLSDGHKYIVTMLVERPHNDYHAKEFIEQASKIVYDEIAI